MGIPARGARSAGPRDWHPANFKCLDRDTIVRDPRCRFRVGVLYHGVTAVSNFRTRDTSDCPCHGASRTLWASIMLALPSPWGGQPLRLNRVSYHAPGK